ncbi:MAG: SDR family oxidoreductase [Planctomycetaceae bacterium]
MSDDTPTPPRGNSLAGTTLLVTGSSRGIGLAIALAAARAGAAVAIVAKTESPHPKLPGTIHDAAAAVEAAGGRALALACDIRDEAAVERAVAATAERFGGIDACVNNAGAIFLAGTLDTPVKRSDLLHQVNARGAYVVARACLPHLLRAPRPHILSICPPLSLDPRWYAPHPAYTLSKMGMSLTVLALAAEFRGRVAVNALWPRTTIDTAAVRNLLGGEPLSRKSRTPAIMGDAALAILRRPVTESGGFHLDEDVLRAEGVTDFSPYAVTPGGPLQDDLFV